MIDHQVKEIELEYLTLEACQKNVRRYLSKIQENKIEVKTICRYGMTYDMQQIHTRIFDEISKSRCEDFLADVKWQKSEWIKYPSTFNKTQSMVDFKNLYTNYKSTGLWDA